ncbi:MAG: hypothetical protein JWP41_4040 [Ramlibacter sp.]|jgi:hypothetical protein|nr:hypothetical protein [Ramlibacter sp.]
MDAQLMIRTAVVLLAVTAAGGLLAAAFRFSGRPHPPSVVAMLHGLLAASGLTLVLYVAVVNGLPEGAWIGLIALLAAVLGGLVLNLGYHWKDKPLPIWLVLVHAAVALVGLVILTLATWNLAPA